MIAFPMCARAVLDGCGRMSQRCAIERSRQISREAQDAFAKAIELFSIARRHLFYRMPGSRREMDGALGEIMQHGFVFQKSLPEFSRQAIPLFETVLDQVASLLGD